MSSYHERGPGPDAPRTMPVTLERVLTVSAVVGVLVFGVVEAVQSALRSDHPFRPRVLSDQEHGGCRAMHTCRMREYLNADEVLGLAELLEDAPNRVGVVDDVLRAAAEGRGMTLRLSEHEPELRDPRCQ